MVSSSWQMNSIRTFVAILFSQRLQKGKVCKVLDLGGQWQLPVLTRRLSVFVCNFFVSDQCTFSQLKAFTNASIQGLSSSDFLSVG